MGLSPSSSHGNGGSQPVTLALFADAVDLRTAVNHPFLWTRAFSDATISTEVFAVPADLGLAIAIDGSSQNIETTEAGVWAFTLTIPVAPDATWAGFIELDPNGADIAQFMPVWTGLGSANRGAVSETVMLPAGYVVAPMMITAAEATANPLSADATLVIVRLA